MRSLLAAAALLFAGFASAQNLTLPRDGDNQRTTITQHIGIATVTIDYHSPDVHAPDGHDRRGNIWGKLVPYGMTDEAFGTCTQCPWRAGANENTTFEVSHDVKIEGQPLPAGKYALFMIAGPEEWTLVLSKNNHSWGAFFYEPSEDQLRVKVKPNKSEYHEWLTYEFTDRDPDHATVALKWEDLEVPWNINVDNMTDLYLAALRQDLRTDAGFQWQNWERAAQYAIQNKRAPEALEFAQGAVGFRFIGRRAAHLRAAPAERRQEGRSAARVRAEREKASERMARQRRPGPQLLLRRPLQRRAEIREARPRPSPRSAEQEVPGGRDQEAGGGEGFEYLRRIIAMMPRSGRGARNAKAHSQPTRSTSSGIMRMDTVVIRKPMQVCSVSAVPR